MKGVKFTAGELKTLEKMRLIEESEKETK